MIQRSVLVADGVLDAMTAGNPRVAALRDEVRGFAATALPDDIRRKVRLNEHLAKDDHLRWQRILHEKGWLTAHWPVAHGGLGWSRLERWVFENEIYRAGSPWLVPFGITYVAPVIYTYGTAEQQARWLPPTANSEIWWAQGYSEPGAGSDLAALRTRAVRDGEHYVVSGTKIWTTMAGWADMMFALVRTDAGARPQAGISFLLIDLASPGVTVRPIPTIDLDDHLNEVFLDEVRVPAANLIGEEGGGWTYAKFLLGNERLLAAEIGKAQRLLGQLTDFLGGMREGGRPLAESPLWRRRIADLATRALALESLAYQLFAEAEGGRDPGATASVLKIMGSELIQAVTGAAIDLLGTRGLALPPEALAGDAARTGPLPEGGPGALAEYLYGRAATIYGGSGEVQRNILAKAVLGL